MLKVNLRHSLPGAAHEALERMGTGYIDVLLLHHPVDLKLEHDHVGALRGAWEAMERLVDDGLVRTIGFSNTGSSLLRFVLDWCRIPPAIDQVEFHPYHQQRDLLDMCTAAGIRLQAYAHSALPGGALPKGQRRRRRIPSSRRSPRRGHALRAK